MACGRLKTCLMSIFMMLIIGTCIPIIRSVPMEIGFIILDSKELMTLLFFCNISSNLKKDSTPNINDTYNG
jgi:hypothetical protein